MEINIKCYLEYGVGLVLCSSKGGGRKKKLRAQRCEMGEERRLYAGWLLRPGGPRRRQTAGDLRDVQRMDGQGQRPRPVLSSQDSKRFSPKANGSH